MIAKTLRKLIPALLVLALVLPCALTVPVSAAGAATVHYEWKTNATDREADAAALDANIRFAGENGKVDSTTHWWAVPTFQTVSGPVKKIAFCFSTVAYDTHGLPYETLSDGRFKATEGLKIELAKMGPIALENSIKAVALTMDYVWLADTGAPNAGIDRQMEIYVSVSEAVDGQYTYLTTPAKVRTCVYQGAGSYTNTGKAQGAHLYRITSENLLDIPGVTDADSITSIMFKPYGDSVVVIGSWGVSGLQVETFADAAVFGQTYPKTEAEMLPVSENTLRSIVVEEARKVSQFEWTPSVDVLSLCPTGASGTTSTAIAMLYRAGETYRGPIYTRENDNTYEQLLSRYSSENGSYTYTPYDVNGDGSTNYADTFGMDCASFVFNALSRISAGSNAWAVMTSVDDHKLVPLSGLTVSDSLVYTDSDIISKNTSDELYAAYAALKPGDVALSYNAGSKVHTRIVSGDPVLLDAQGYPVDNVADCDPAKSYIPCHEEHCSTVYQFAKGNETVSMKVETTASINASDNSLSGSTVEQEIAEARAEYNEKYAALCAQYGVDELTPLYGQSARTGEPYTFAQLEEDLYAPYTLTDYQAGEVEQANVDIVIAGKNYGCDYDDGFTVGVSSNYRVIDLTLTLKDSAGKTAFEKTVYADDTHAYATAFDSASDDELTALLNDGKTYTMTVTVTSGPVTEENGAVPTTSKSVKIEKFSSTKKLPDVTGGATLAENGKYVLTADTTASGTITVSGDVTLCLHGNTLSNGITATSDAHAPLIKVVSGGRLTICDCAGGGRIYGDGENHPYVYGIHVGSDADYARVYLEGGTITGFKNTGGNGGGVYLNDTASQFVMNGGEISNNTAANGGGVYDRYVFKFNGGKITGNTATSNGGGVYSTASNFAVSGGEISNNTAANGGGVYAANKLVMSGGTISGNTAVRGGGIYNSRQFYMEDGAISNNKAIGTDTNPDPGTGGGIYSSAGVTLSGGTISGNGADNNGGGVYSRSDALTLDGPVIITKNSATNGGGIHVQNTEWPQYGKMAMSAGTIIDNEATGNGGGVYFAGGSTDGFKMTGGTITENGAVDGAGVYLTAPAKGDGTVGKEVFFTMDAGTISNNTATGYGGGVLVSGNSDTGKNGTFTMNGGEISGNAAAVNGGGVRNDSKGTFYLKGGKISKNTATDGAGVANSWWVYLYGGEISGNEAADDGGGVYSTTTGLNLYDGVRISGNKAAYGGGIESTNKISMDGGSIIDNSATKSGGGVYFSGSNGFVMNDGEISGNRAKDGGGIYLSNANASFTMYDGIIGGDTLDQANFLVGADGSVYGNAIYVGSGTANLYGGKIAGNISDNTVITKGGTPITTASGNGAVWISTGTVMLGKDGTGTQIYGNKGRYTGGIWINGAGTFTMTGGSIGMNGDTAAPNTSSGSTAFYFSGTGATATISGGSINGTYTNKGNLTVSGGEFTQNPTTYYVNTTTHNIQTGEKNSTTWYNVVKVEDTPESGWNKLTAGGTLTGGNYILLNDVTLTESIVITGDVTIDLNGYDIISTVNAITIGTSSVGGSLTLKDSGAPYGELKQSGTTGRSAVTTTAVSAGCKFTLDDGVITGFTANPVVLYNYGSFTMNGGKITNCNGYRGMVVMYASNNVFTMNGGEITGNTTTGPESGAVYNDRNGKVIINGGLLDGRGCVGTSAGYTAETYPNGLAVTNYGTGSVTVTGGQVVGGLYNNSGAVTVTGGKFSENPTEYLAAGHWEESITEGALKFRVTKPDITGTVVNLGNALGIKFYVSINEDKVDLSDYTVKYSREYNYEEGDENAKADVVDLKITLTASDDPAAGNYMFYYTGISAKEMCDQVTLTICSGDVVMDTLAESLQSYAARLLAYSGSKAADKKAVVDMLVYGEKAQNYFGYGLDNLATSILTEAQKALATASDPTCEKLTPAEGYAGTIISLQDNIVLKMYIDKAKAGENSVAAITYTNHAGSNVSGTAQVKAYGNNYVEVVVDTLAVADARTVVTCTIGEYSCSYSIEACVAAALASEEAEISAAEAVTVAMMKFADSAYAVLHPAAES